MTNKKSLAMTDAIVWLVIMAIVIFVVAVIVPRLLGKSGAEASDLLSSSKDYDTDGIADYYDKCDCLIGDERNDGCPINEKTEGDIAIKREQKCKEEISKRNK